MPADYKHIFFDLDHTLWDYDFNAEQTLRKLYKKYNLENLKISHNLSEDSFVSHYHVANRHVWQEYNHNRISKADLRMARFHIIFDAHNLSYDAIPKDLCEEYFTLCPRQTQLMPHTIKILENLADRYILHIISNGFEKTQNIKLEYSGIKKYFFSVTTSENSGFKKPSQQIFDFALGQADAKAHESLMIGDSPEADICGAVGAGLDAVFYNPTGQKHIFDLPKEVRQIVCLSELMDFGK